jgi:Fic-DOC domain mobile mystery protein B
MLTSSQRTFNISPRRMPVLTSKPTIERSHSGHERSTLHYIRSLHQRMFDETWKWAGQYRTSEKNIGLPHHQIREQLEILIGDTSYWIENATFPPDETAIRFHHRLVFIHPFANGNGRHARLMADVLAKLQGRPEFTWGSADIMVQGDIRRGYIDASRAADKNDIAPLLAFARS